LAAAYIVFSSVATPSVLSPFEGPAFEAKGTGKRALLGEAWCADITDQLRQHLDVSANLSEDAIAMQCRLIDRSPARNTLGSPNGARPATIRSSSGGGYF